jgi:hypothetical protein
MLKKIHHRGTEAQRRKKILPQMNADNTDASSTARQRCCSRVKMGFLRAQRDREAIVATARKQAI